MWNLTRIEVLLCNILSPEAPPLSLASYNWCKVSTSSSGSQTKAHTQKKKSFTKFALYIDGLMMLSRTCYSFQQGIAMK